MLLSSVYYKDFSDFNFGLFLVTNKKLNKYFSEFRMSFNFSDVNNTGLLIEC